MIARLLAPGWRLRRGSGWWLVERASVEPRRLGGPVVVLRCLDEHNEVREFTLPDDIEVTAVEPGATS